MICNHCGTANREGELICATCGSLLTAPAATRRLKVSTGVLAREDVRVETGTLQLVTFSIEGLDYDFPMRGKGSILIGRGCTDDISTLDLMTIGGDERGVSRKHAVLHVEKAQAYLVDLGSTNGTYLNGRRIPANHKFLLYSGDMLRFGALEARIQLA